MHMLNATREGAGGCRTLGGRVSTVDGLDVRFWEAQADVWLSLPLSCTEISPSIPQKQSSQLARPWGSLAKLNQMVVTRELPAFPPEFPSLSWRVLGWVCISVCQKEISSCAERQAWGSVWQSLGHREGQLPRKWFSRWVWHWVPAHTLTPLTAFFASLLNILKGWLCRLFLWLLFWQSIAPWCQLNLSNKKEANVKF